MFSPKEKVRLNLGMKGSISLFVVLRNKTYRENLKGAAAELYFCGSAGFL